ncbi:hypothetical protein BDW22DRAFT_852143 [Trametopsis cervina]|nr:hypothetical protein BDW22DRAFT_852143 [Trametopsis cervina]
MTTTTSLSSYTRVSLLCGCRLPRLSPITPQPLLCTAASRPLQISGYAGEVEHGAYGAGRMRNRTRMHTRVQVHSFINVTSNFLSASIWLTRLRRRIRGRTQEQTKGRLALFKSAARSVYLAHNGDDAMLHVASKREKTDVVWSLYREKAKPSALA